MLFSIVIVALNAGDKLTDTLKSVLGQSCTDYEVIIKDGGSRDGSVEKAGLLLKQKTGAQGAGEARIYQEKDTGIYDAMNQAVSHVQGRYVLFLNCGDSFYDADVLKRTKDCIMASGITDGLRIYYGNVFEKQTGEVVPSNPRIDAFACYRNIPCHQVCFYDRRLFTERSYDTKYRVRADYEHFLWCYFVKKAEMIPMTLAVASYEGGGFSETPENRRVSAAEHREITRRYLTAGQRMGYRMLLWLTLAPLRRRMAQSRRMAGIYQKLKGLLYRKDGNQ